METLDQHSGTTGRLRLRLSYAPGPEGPETVFVKLPPFDESQRKLVAATDMGRARLASTKARPRRLRFGYRSRTSLPTATNRRTT